MQPCLNLSRQVLLLERFSELYPTLSSDSGHVHWGRWVLQGTTCLLSIVHLLGIDGGVELCSPADKPAWR